MKPLLRSISIFVTAVVLLVPLITAGVLWQIGMLNREGIREVTDFVSKNPPSTVLDILMLELGIMGDVEADPTYGRQLVEGRGQAPWVVRGNLDERFRMLSFAVAPGVWAAYETQYGSLYQVWRGDILFHGAVYDYRHGPQPTSTGEWVLHNAQPVSWTVQHEGQDFPADVHYLGHQYSSRKATASLSFELSANGVSAIVTEQPELLPHNDEQRFVRNIRVASETPGISLAMTTDTGETHVLQIGNNTIILPMGQGTAIGIPTSEQLSSSEGDIEKGKRIVLNSDCMGCHNETQQVVGPAFARIAKRFRGYLQEGPVEALVSSIIDGSKDKWGQVPMPAHRTMSEEDARAAVLYILNLSELEAEQDTPTNEKGVAYSSTRDYSVGDKLVGLHPAFTLENLLPEGFKPKVGGLDFLSDGKLVLASWDADGAVFLIDPYAPMEKRVIRIAEGLQEPLGLTVVGDKIYVLQKQEITLLVDTDGDEIIDEYRSFSSGWPTNSNFHSFAFGMIHKEGYLYALLSICIQPGGATCPEQMPSQGKAIRVSLADGSVEYVASGFRTPNGIGLGPGGDIFATDNQGDWLPSSKLVHITQGSFYGCKVGGSGTDSDIEETAPAVWMPQDEIGNSPTQPALLNEGPYSGQMVYGDVYHGGMKRIYLEKVNNAWQGAVFRFSAGFNGSVNRIARGPDNALYVGEIGNPPNWGEVDKPWYGLDRLSYRGEPAYEILRVNATSDGFTLTLSEPLAQGLKPVATDLIARQWFYYPTEQYGGPKYDTTELAASSLTLSADRRQIHLVIPGLKKGYVVYLALDRRLRSQSDKTLWAYEAWYTLNAIPETQGEYKTPDASADIPSNSLTVAEKALGWRLLFDGKSFGKWRNYGSHEPVEKWLVEEGTIKLPGTRVGTIKTWINWVFGMSSDDLIYGEKKFRDFELSLQWKISENGNSGIFYFVADEEHASPWETGLEMQVLHNEGHRDGKIPKHRAGDLYDLISADPETVRPPGVWNEVQIRVKNRRVEQWLNGTKVVSYTHGGEQWDAMVGASKFSGMPDFGKAQEGYIVLQDHGDKVWYRNIKIREL